MKPAIVLALSLLAAALAFPASADTTLSYSVSHGDQSAPMTLKVRPGKIRIEGSAVGERFKWMLYRREDNTLYAVDPQRKIYYAIDPQTIKQLSQRLDALRAQLRERLKLLPPEQRKRIEAQIGGFLDEPRGEPMNMAIELSGDTKTIAGVTCEQGLIMASDKSVGELCIAAPDALGLSESAFDAFRGMYALITDFQTALSNDSFQADISSLKGVPVRMHTKFNGATQTLQNVSHEELPNYLFEIPENYQRQGAQALTQ